MKWDKSEWYFPKDWLFILGLQVIVPTISIIFACFLPAVSYARQGDPTLFWIALFLAVTGIFLLFIARLPLYRQRKFFTFGSKALPERHQRIYRIAYVFIGLGVVIMLTLLTVLR